MRNCFPHLHTNTELSTFARVYIRRETQRFQCEYYPANSSLGLWIIEWIFNVLLTPWYAASERIRYFAKFSIRISPVMMKVLSYTRRVPLIIALSHTKDARLWGWRCHFASTTEQKASDPPTHCKPTSLKLRSWLVCDLVTTFVSVDAAPQFCDSHQLGRPNYNYRCVYISHCSTLQFYFCTKAFPQHSITVKL